jgi:hypothetical protein
MRCLLLSSLLSTLTLDPPARTHFYEITYIVLGLYVSSRALLYAAVPERLHLLPESIAPWLDASWTVELMGLRFQPTYHGSLDCALFQRGDYTHIRPPEFWLSPGGSMVPLPSSCEAI